MRHLFFLTIIVPFCLFGQEVRITGVVLDRTTLDPVLGTAIYNESLNTGAISDSVGFFSLRVRTGDTIVFRDVRYLSSTLIIPDVLDHEEYAIVELLTNKTLVLDEIEIYALPSEERFKEIFLSIEPKPDLNSRAIEARQDLMETIRESYEDPRLYYNTWAHRRIYDLTGEMPPNYFLDPFRWSLFVRSLKNEKGR